MFQKKPKKRNNYINIFYINICYYLTLKWYLHTDSCINDFSDERNELIIEVTTGDNYSKYHTFFDYILSIEM
jgi:hypothetical protein